MTATGAAAAADEAEQVRRLWSGLGLPGLIDVHTHFMPPEVLAKVWAYFDSAGPLVGRPWPITYRTSDDERVQTLRAFGLRTFTALAYPHKPDMAAWLNRWTMQFAAKTPGCLPSATFYPEEGAGAEVASVIEQGAAIFKAHLQVGGYDPNDPHLDEVWGVLQEAGTPVVIHAGSGPAPGRFTGPGPIEGVLRRYPRLRLIVAHLGMPEYAAFLDLAQRYRDVYLDTTMSFTDFTQDTQPFPPALTPRLLDVGDKVLLGSDFPNIPYPYLHQLQALRRLELGDTWLRAVLHDNAARVFGLPS